MKANHRSMIEEGFMLLAAAGAEEASRERNPEAHVQLFMEEVVPQYTDVQFKEHFRMSRTVFEVMLSEQIINAYLLV